MKIQLLSDLHLEYAPFEPVITDASVIVLAGDISEGTAGISWARQIWKTQEIVYVPGNHEYYNSDIDIENECMRMAGIEYGVHVLNRSEVTIQGVRFLGATLWTNFRLFGEDERPWAYQAALHGVPDFRRIDYGGQPFSPQDAANLHAGDVAWLETKLKRKPFAGKTVVVTHHAPSPLSLVGSNKKALRSAAYASDLSGLMGNAAVWMHGHTHSSMDYVLEGTRVVCNPRGYCKTEEQAENVDFEKGFTIFV